VTLQGRYREPPIYDWQGTGVWEYTSVFWDQWFGTGSFTGNTFTATWTDRPTDSVSNTTETGIITVTVDPTTFKVTSFYATHTRTDPLEIEGGGVTTATIRGNTPPMISHNSSAQFAHLRYSTTGVNTCDYIDALEYRVDRRPSEWVTNLPWTLLIGRDCLGTEPTPGIEIVLKLP
jgi:hypothetical protein